MEMLGSSTPVSSSHRPNWVMLDSYVRLNYDHPEDREATFAQEKTSIAECVGVWFRTVPPPGSSRLYVSWAERRPDTSGSSTGGKRRLSGAWTEPRVVAAHGNSILLQFTLNAGSYCPFADFLVYTIRSDGAPSLFRLPTCPHKLLSGRLRCGGLPHMRTIGGIGLLSDVDDGYVVADLQVLPNKDNADTPLEAQLCIFQSHSPDEWQLARPQIRHQSGQGKDLIWWSTDTVIPYGDALCYVDYLRGILVANVRSDCSQLHYIPLPVRVPTGNPADPELGTRGCPHMLRSVCTTKGGMLKFVDVVCTTVFVAGSRSPIESNFEIKLWSLSDVNKAWKQETVLGDAELWSLEGYGDLPHVVPEFPLVSMEDPSIIYFLLTNDSDDSSGDANTWIIIVDVLNRTVRSSTQYTIVDKLSNYDGDMASRNLAANEAFIPCEFSQYLKVDDTSAGRDEATARGKQG